EYRGDRVGHRVVGRGTGLRRVAGHQQAQRRQRVGALHHPVQYDRGVGRFGRLGLGLAAGRLGRRRRLGGRLVERVGVRRCARLPLRRVVGAGGVVVIDGVTVVVITGVVIVVVVVVVLIPAGGEQVA